MKRRALGAAGERKAARHLRRHGLRIIARNWRCKHGELDILARDGEVLVVVEVRTASGPRPYAGEPALTVGPRKQARLMRLAQYWLAQQSWRPRGIRFDVIGLTRERAFKWSLRWYQRAFEHPGES